MTMKRVLGVMLLVLLACGPSGDTSTSSPAKPPKRGSEFASKQLEAKDLEAYRDSYVWSGASQPPHDWDVDVEACKARVDKARRRVHPLGRIAMFMECMKEMGWEPKAENP